MARRTAAARAARSISNVALDSTSLDSDMDVTMAGSNVCFRAATTENDNDYPTPKSEEDSQKGGPFAFPDEASENIKKLSSEPRKLLTAINNIASLGIDHQELDLPKIVVVGDQSAGKSSAIAAISAISVPRKAGVCTRCPTHIILHNDPESNCVVSIERQYVLDDNAWAPMRRPTVTRFTDVTNSEQLQHTLSRAQAAVLNPQCDPKEFVSCPLSEIDQPSQAQFSPNLIRLEISGPDCPELTFYDLPGIFSQTANDEDRDLPKLVRNLVLQYIEPENHIILLACSMENDMENSKASGMLREHHNAKNRSIGLLTKPDRLPEGNPIQAWTDILAGKTYSLAHQYYVTKQPSQKDLSAGVTIAQARKDEETFFRRNHPWCGELSAYKDRFGTENLQIKLSEVLVSEIQANIPDLIDKVQSGLVEIDEQLSKLPAPPKDAYFTVMRLLGNIENRLGQIMQGELPHHEFIKRWKALYERFFQNMTLCRPTLMIYSAEEREAIRSARERFKIMESQKNNSPRNPITLDEGDDDDDDMSLNGNAMAGRKRSSSSTPSPSKRARHAPSPTSRSPNNFSLENVQEIRLDQNTSAIGGVDHRAEEHIIIKTIEAWRSPLDEFVNASKKALMERIETLLEEELQGWKGSLLYKELRKYVQSWIEEAATDIAKFGQRIIDGERLKPMTVNVASKAKIDAEEIQTLREHRWKRRANLFFDEEQAKTGKKMTDVERDSKMTKQKEKIENELGKDPWDKEIEIMGRVRGYYAVSSSSFVDTVCKVMRVGMFDKCRADMIRSVETLFKLRGCSSVEAAQECERLLAEDLQRAQKRLDLQIKKEKYEKAKKQLEELYE